MTPATTFPGSATFPSALVSKLIYKSGTITRINITVNFSGTLRVVVRTDSNTWEDVGTLTSGVIKSYTLTNSGNTLEYRIVGESGAKVFNTYNDDLSYKKPAISIQLIE